MPSRGNAVCQRCASSEYSTFVTGESASRTSAATTNRVPSRRMAPSCTVGETLSISKLLLSSSPPSASASGRSEEHTSELQSLAYLVCRLLLEKKNYMSIESTTLWTTALLA